MESNPALVMYIITLLTCAFAQTLPSSPSASTFPRPTLLRSLSAIARPSSSHWVMPTLVKTVTHTITVTHTVTQTIVLPVLITVTQIVTVTQTVTPLPPELAITDTLSSTNQALTATGIAIVCTAILFGVMLYSFLKARKSKPIASSPKQVVYDARPKLNVDTTVAYNWPTHTRDLSV